MTQNGNGGKPESTILCLPKRCLGCPTVFGRLPFETETHFGHRRYCSKSCYEAAHNRKKSQARENRAAQLPPCRVCDKPLYGPTKSGLHLGCRGMDHEAPPLRFPGADFQRIDQAATTCLRCGSAGLQPVDEGLLCRICGKRIRIAECLAAMVTRGGWGRHFDARRR